MMERKERKPYWRHTKWQMLASVLPFLVLIIVLPLYAEASTRSASWASRSATSSAPTASPSSPSSRWAASSTARMPSITGTGRTRTCRADRIHMSLTSRTRLRQPAARNLFRHLRQFVRRTACWRSSSSSSAPPTVLRWGMLFGPLALYAAIGLVVPTQEPRISSPPGVACRRAIPGWARRRRVGRTGLVAITGVFFLIGFDALCLMIGGLAGFVFMTVMLAPFFRKFGAFTVPSYLGRRFESKTVRLLCASCWRCRRC